MKAFLAKGYTANPEYARQALRELPYGRWRDYNPEDTLRFYALRLREAGMVKSPPQKLIAREPTGGPGAAQARTEGVDRLVNRRCAQGTAGASRTEC